MVFATQALAILLSCLLYGHPMTAYGLMGILVVFAAIFMRIYCADRLKKRKKVVETDVRTA